MRSIKVVTRQDRANTAAARWKKVYCDERTGEWSHIVKVGGSKGLHDRLAALPQPVDLLAVEGIIGNRSWTLLTCDQCGKSVDAVVSMVNGEYGEDIALCFGCVMLAHEEVRVYLATHARAPDTF